MNIVDQMNRLCPQGMQKYYTFFVLKYIYQAMATLTPMPDENVLLSMSFFLGYKYLAKALLKPMLDLC